MTIDKMIPARMQRPGMLVGDCSHELCAYSDPSTLRMVSVPCILGPFLTLLSHVPHCPSLITSIVRLPFSS